MEDVLDRLKKEREKVDLNATEKMHKASNYRMGHIMIMVTLLRQSVKMVTL